MAKGRSKDVRLYINNLQKDLETLQQELGKEFAKTVRDELVKESTLAIARYYTDWSPDYYIRNYYNLMDNTFKPYYSNQHGKRFVGGVEFDPGFMAEIYKPRLKAVDIFESAIEDGRHGWGWHSEKPQPIMDESPMEMIRNHLDYIEDHKTEYVNKCFNKLVPSHYNILFHNKKK